MSKNTNPPVRVFIVHLKRYGNDEAHNYLWGIYSTYKQALKETKIAMTMRAGKYDGFIYEGYMGKRSDLKIYRRVHWGDEF